MSPSGAENPVSGRWTIDELLARGPARLVRVALGTCRPRYRPMPSSSMFARLTNRHATRTFPGAVAVDRTVLVAA